MNTDAGKRERIAEELIALDKTSPNSQFSFQKFKSIAPEFSALVEQSVKSVNGDSSLDKEVKTPATVTIDFDGDAAMATSSRSDDGKSHLHIRPTYFVDKDLSEIRSVLTHEIGHDAHGLKLDKVNGEAISVKRGSEYEADRYADAKETISSHLKNVQNEPNQYDYFSKISSHPNQRERIGALLAEEYGNDVFKHSGKVSQENGEFNPTRDKNGVPLTESSEKILNWDAELAPAIKAQVNSSLKVLDHLVDSNHDGIQDLTDEDVKNFNQHVRDTSEKIKQEHQPKLSGELKTSSNDSLINPSSAFTGGQQQSLANSFRNDDHSNLEITQKNIAQEAKMAPAYLALHLVSEQIKGSGLQPEAQRVSIAMTKESLAKGIEKNEYPNFQRLEPTRTAVEQANELQLSMNS